MRQMKMRRATDRQTPIRIVAGMQYGSEAKGMVAAALCREFNIDYAVRTGAVNAGHTVYYSGKAYKMQQLPTGWVNPDTRLVIGPGALVNETILDHERVMIAEATGEVRVPMIDPRAAMHDWGHTERSMKSGRHHSMGATGKGCSEALIDRIKNRGTGKDTILGPTRANKYGMAADVERLLNEAYDDGASILLEGTQGQGLDLLLGPWPFTSHKPTSPAQWLVENGLSPNLKTEIVGVARTHPIRVAGNSGPLAREMSWPEMTAAIGVRSLDGGLETSLWRLEPVVEFTKKAQEMAERWAVEGKLPRYTDTEKANFAFHTWHSQTRDEYRMAVSEFHSEVMRALPQATVEELSKTWEYTTVTRKLRRVAQWDVDQIKDSIRQMRPNYIVLTFLNYWFPEVDRKTELSERAIRRVHALQKEIGVEIRYVTTGPEGHHMLSMEA